MDADASVDPLPQAKGTTAVLPGIRRTKGFLVGAAAASALAWGMIGFSFAEHERTKHGFANGFLTACGRPCFINGNPGGSLADYMDLAAVVVERHRLIVINGACASACATMAALARPNVVITPNALFLFHKASNETD